MQFKKKTKNEVALYNPVWNDTLSNKKKQGADHLYKMGMERIQVFHGVFQRLN